MTPRRSFTGDGGGAVGLGIVAAMGAAAVKSNPIPILPSSSTAAERLSVMSHVSEEDEELSETYTCVVSYVGGKKKIVYLDGGAFSESPPPANFLCRCYLCHKNLQGLDIFMYRGDTAFCSVECRWQQILNDELGEKCYAETLNPCSESPCSAPIRFFAGLAAA